MEELSLTTPALLFSAISLILLAYTNRFLAYASLVRSLHEKYRASPDESLLPQINNLRKRLNLTRAMQSLGIWSLLLCVATMFLIYVSAYVMATYVFAVALLSLIVSLTVSAREIRISVKALDFQLKDLEGK